MLAISGNLSYPTTSDGCALIAGFLLRKQIMRFNEADRAIELLWQNGEALAALCRPSKPRN